MTGTDDASPVVTPPKPDSKKTPPEEIASPSDRPFDIEELAQKLEKGLTQQLERSLNAKLTPLAEKIEQIQETVTSGQGEKTASGQSTPPSNGQMAGLFEKLDRILENTKLGDLERLSKDVEDIRNQAKQSNKQDAIALLSDAAKQVAGLTQDLEELKKVDLRLASEEEIKNALSEAGVQSQYIDPALAAIEHWKQEGRTLSWENLKKSCTSGNPAKVPKFGLTTYDKLREIAKISE
ncbi:MAG: hypothetical protein HC925_08760 [Coleofasciculaceae cyanobacterium SM2_3_26]|nr:hypothetical protein [Coleofasciculaceae cyanobacterium SM2_3_26]